LGKGLVQQKPPAETALGILTIRYSPTISEQRYQAFGHQTNAQENLLEYRWRLFREHPRLQEARRSF
jgi:hypothetical protein